MFLKQLLSVVLLGTLSAGLVLPAAETEDGGQLWAVLAAGSQKYENYRHQSDVSHAYQVLDLLSFKATT